MVINHTQFMSKGISPGRNGTGPGEKNISEWHSIDYSIVVLVPGSSTYCMFNLYLFHI